MLDQFTRQKLIPGLLDSKALYEAAENEELQKRLGQSAEQIRSGAHETAEMLRGIAQSKGIDVRPYGEGVKLQQAQQNLLKNDYEALQEILGSDLTSEQFYDQQYAKARNEGLKHSDAQRRAGGEARRYKASRMARLNSGLNMYGLTDGAINPYGAEMLSYMLSETGNPEASIATLYNQLYAGPKDERQAALDRQARDEARAAAREQIRLNHENDLDKLERQFLYNWDTDEHRGDISRDTYKINKGVDYNYDRKGKEADKKLEINAYEAKAYIDLETQRMSDEQKIEFAKNVAETLGFPKGTAEYNYIVGGVPIPRAEGSSKSGSEKGEKLSAADEKLYRASTTLFMNAFKEPSDENIGKLREWLKEYGLELPPDAYQEMQYLPALLKGLQYKRNYDDDNATAMWSKVPPDLLEEYLPNENWDYYKERWGKK